MAPKAKNVAGSKRSTKGKAFGSGNREPTQKFRKKVVKAYGLLWFDCQREPKYMGDEYVDEVRLQTQIPAMYRTIVKLGLKFILDHSDDCNLTLVREFYANWLTKTQIKHVHIKGNDVRFSARVLNDLLGIPNCDTDEFNRLKETLLYRDIRHTLCEVESTVIWGCSKDTGRHNTLNFVNFNLFARVWLKIVCSVLLPAKHLSEERQPRDDNVMARMFGIAELQLRIGGCSVTDAEMETMA
uniref:Putative plant transposon protein domain-containing protein n=1 Tax=Solanum tuberosum TaxID=4113 RepID=M1E0K3_SOLTU